MTSSNSDPVTLEEVQWRKVFPLLNLFHAARMSYRLRVLIPAFMAVCCFQSGVEFLGEADTTRLPKSLDSGLVPSEPLKLLFNGSSIVQTLAGFVWGGLSGERALDAASVAGFGLGLVLLSFFGVAISRSMATEFCRSTRTGPVAAVRCSIRHRNEQIVLLITMTVVAGLVVAPLLVLKLVGSSGWLASAGIFWVPLNLLVVFTLLACLVIFVGGLISIPAIGTDSCSGTDAFSRGVNYFLSHKTRTVSCLIIVSLLSQFCFMATRILFHVSGGIIQNCLPVSSSSAATADASVAAFSGPAMSMSEWIIARIPEAVQLSVFLCGLTITYVLLRLTEDAVRISEIDGAVVTRSRRNTAT